MMVGEAKPGIGGERLPFQKLPPPNSSIPRGQGTDLPAWVAFDRQVLAFLLPPEMAYVYNRL